MKMHPDEAILNSYVDEDLGQAERIDVQRHLHECATCRSIVDDLRAVTRAAAALHDTPLEPPDDAWTRIQRVIERRRPAHGFNWRTGLAAAAAMLLVVAASFSGGVAVGRQLAPAAKPDPQLASLQQEVRDMRQMVTLSLLQQRSASERLNGVMWTDRIENPGSEVIAALLDTLMHDPNVNVRLATVNALKRFSTDTTVRHGAVEALTSPSAPLLQIALIDFLVEASASESADVLRRLSQDPQVDQAVRGRAELGLQRIG
jgi:hypothetical protein